MTVSGRKRIELNYDVTRVKGPVLPLWEDRVLLDEHFDGVVMYEGRRYWYSFAFDMDVDGAEPERYYMLYDLPLGELTKREFWHGEFCQHVSESFDYRDLNGSGVWTLPDSEDRKLKGDEKSMYLQYYKPFWEQNSDPRRLWAFAWMTDSDWCQPEDGVKLAKEWDVYR